MFKIETLTIMEFWFFITTVSNSAVVNGIILNLIKAHKIQK